MTKREILSLYFYHTATLIPIVFLATFLFFAFIVTFNPLLKKLINFHVTKFFQLLSNSLKRKVCNHRQIFSPFYFLLWSKINKIYEALRCFHVRWISTLMWLTRVDEKKTQHSSPENKLYVKEKHSKPLGKKDCLLPVGLLNAFNIFLKVKHTLSEVLPDGIYNPVLIYLWEMKNFNKLLWLFQL